jgi:hypothetical protein
MPGVKVTLRIALVVLLGAGLQKPAVTLAVPQTQATGRMLLATVVDLSGKTQVDIGVDDLLVKKGGDEREVLDVHIADYPIVVLIDDGPGSNDLRPIKSAIARVQGILGLADQHLSLRTLAWCSCLRCVEGEIADGQSSPQRHVRVPANITLARVESDTAGKFYEIALDPKNVGFCTCDAGRYLGHTCKHLKAFRATLTKAVA